jgi:hypothetical protein
MHRSLALSAIRTSVKGTAPRVTARASPGAIAIKRSLVSSVLLDRDVYDKKNVAQLKGELKQRGLSTTGKRKDLVDRLMSSDGRNARVLPSGESNPPSQSRRASTKSASSSAAKDNIKPETSQGSVGVTGKATVSHPPDIEPGQVSSNAHDETGAITKTTVLEAPPTAPGVPPEKAPQVPVTFDVKIPYEKVGEDKGPVIPLMTGYFHPETPLFTGFVDYDGPIAHMPKVMTISGEATYPGGGPAHHNADFEEPDISRTGLLSDNVTKSDELSISSAINSMFKTMRDDLGIPIDAATEKKAKATANSTASSTTSLLKEARDNLAARVGSMSSGSGSSSASYSTSSSSSGSARPMNDEETRGREYYRPRNSKIES